MQNHKCNEVGNAFPIFKVSRLNHNAHQAYMTLHATQSNDQVLLALEKYPVNNKTQDVFLCYK